ncbi:MAG: hypothetical protein KC964_31075 [Candidatus Omnitrophica bacterium]|nr:hypothetical protein [Candidatus Omnitrophota bacterium]
MPNSKAVASLELLEDGKIRIGTQDGIVTVDKSTLLDLMKWANHQVTSKNEDGDETGIFVPFLVEFQVDADGNESLDTEHGREVDYDFFLSGLAGVASAAMRTEPDELPNGVEISVNP